MASKILVLGAVHGDFSAAFAKLATLHSKNNFSFAIIVGDLFGGDDDALSSLLAGQIAIPLPTYFTVGTSPLPSRVVEILQRDEDICADLHYLGRRSTTKTSEGIKIVTLGGQFDEKRPAGPSADQFEPFHSAADARSLLGAHSADILITSQWPASISKGSQVKFPESFVQPDGAKHISELCSVLKPRYHFSPSADFFYEREPFFHTPEDGDPDDKFVTRFYALASWGNEAKQKSLYAFNLQPSAAPPVTLPAGCTASPFLGELRRKRPAESERYSRYSHSHGDGHRHKRSRPRGPPRPDECFFCLSNPNLATHLVASIGDEAYLAAAKGPLTTFETNADAGLKTPGHILIIPLSHSPTLASISEEESRLGTYQEMNRYKEALQNMVASCSSKTLGAVTYEISRHGGVHTHWQFLPISADLIRKGLVEAGFRVEAENSSYPSFEVRDPGLGNSDGDFFRVWLWAPAEDGDDQPAKCLTMPLDEDLRFDLQFGRRVLAKLLGLEKRLQWRDCAQTEEEEKADVALFKEAFKPFDFSL